MGSLATGRIVGAISERLAVEGAPLRGIDTVSAMCPPEPRDLSPAGLAPVDPHVIVLVGATGDLARRKLVPGLLHLSQSGLMPEYRVVGVSLEDLDDDAFRELAGQACREFTRHPVDPGEWEEFTARLSYLATDRGPGPLAAAVARARAELGGSPRLLLYLSVPGAPGW